MIALPLFKYIRVLFCAFHELLEIDFNTRVNSFTMTEQSTEKGNLVIAGEKAQSYSDAAGESIVAAKDYVVDTAIAAKDAVVGAAHSVEQSTANGLRYAADSIEPAKPEVAEK